MPRFADVAVFRRLIRGEHDAPADFAKQARSVQDVRVVP